MITASVGVSPAPNQAHAMPNKTSSKASKAFTVCKMTAPAGAGPALFVNLCAFDQTAAAALLRYRFNND